MTNASTLNLEKLNTSQSSKMLWAFGYTGYSISKFIIKGLSDWDMSQTTDMYHMFDNADYSATTFDIGDLSNWNKQNVTNMYYMFARAGLDAGYKLDLSNLDVSKVIHYSMFNAEVDSKIVPPIWVDENVDL